MAEMSARERRRQRTRDDVVDAALAVIEEDGLDAVSIERLVEAAGVSRATLYAHFPDGRDGILRAAYEALGERLLAAANARGASASGWQDRILAYARAMIEFSATPSTGHFYSVAGPALVGFREEGGVGSRGYRSLIAAELAAAQEVGAVDAALDVTATALLLASSLRDAGIAATRDPASVDAFVDAMAHILRGLSRPTEEDR